MPTHIMLDLETLSTRHDAAILQIAAAAFDPLTGEVFATFNAFVRDSTGHVDVQTCAWWMQQNAAATIGAAVASPDADTEERALEDFAAWFASAGEDVEAIWSHGGVDHPWLRSACDRHSIPKPGGYRAERDTRTLYAFTPGGMPAVPRDPARAHDARYDVEIQTKQVVGALQALRYIAERAQVADAFERRETEPAPAPSAAVPTRLPYDPPPVWSNAESYTEALANPVLRSDDLGD